MEEVVGSSPSARTLLMKKEVYRSPPFILEGYIAYKAKYSDGSRRTLLHHREVMEEILGRSLSSTEHVHHKDGNKKNNEPSNLEIMSPAAHAREHARPVEYLTCVCAECDACFTRRASRARWNAKRSIGAGPFCSRRCAGKRNQRMRMPAHREMVDRPA